MEEMILEHNLATGEIKERPATKKEIDDRAKLNAELQQVEKRENELRLARESALAKLAALGLTEDEIAAL